MLTNQVPTRYLDNGQDANLVIDLIFIWEGLDELNNYTIYLD